MSVKYLNSPESIIYSKRKELFGLFQARQAIRKADLCYLVEGYTDVMAMHQQGIENVVSSSGTALTPEQINLIHRITNNITVIFDGDEAGIHASERGIDMLLSQGMNVKLLLLPDGDDPDSFARKHTATEYQQYLQDNQVDFITYKASHLDGANKDAPDAQERLIHNVAESIAVIPDEIKRTIYIRHAAKQLNMPERLIMAAVNAQKKASTVSSQGGVNQANVSPSPLEERKGERLANGPVGLEKSESLIAQMIIRYGEKLICTIEDENGQEVQLSVAEYVYYSLQDDDIQLQQPVYRRILDEAVENAHAPNFRAEQYFNNHPDGEIRELALRLGTDAVELSKIYDDASPIHSEGGVNSPFTSPFTSPSEGTGEAVPLERAGERLGSESLRLDEIVPKLIASYKLGIVQNGLKDIIEQMKLPEVREDKEKSRALMNAFNQRTQLAKELAKVCGERVVLK